MKRSLAVLCLVACAPLLAESPAASGPVPSAAADPRIPIVLADARRENWGCLMRGHLRSLVDAMQHMSAGEYVLAAEVTEDNYALSDGKAEYCREPLFTREASIAAAKLPPQSPDAVRAMFAAMQTSARDFARAARAVPRTRDPAPAWKALAALGENCSACHAAYRLK